MEVNEIIFLEGESPAFVPDCSLVLIWRGKVLCYFVLVISSKKLSK